MKIINIVGARPNFMKIAPLMKVMNKSQIISPLLLHTGQHYDRKMSKLFFEELNIPKPDIYLGVGSDTHAKQVAKIMTLFDDVCQDEKPDAILVVGDVNSTMACSLVAAKLGIKIIHLEAGLRSFDRQMPEEINRIVTDSLSDVLLTPSIDGNKNLINEGVSPEKIHLVGNIMIDTLFEFLPLIKKSQILQALNLNVSEYVLVTLHRPSNVDSEEGLTKIINNLIEIQKKTKVVFPIHPRTLKNVQKFNLEQEIKNAANIILTEPLGYLDFQKLMIDSKLVVTDSGGIQEETTALGIPCVTLRLNTERPVTIDKGTNILIGENYNFLQKLVDDVLYNEWKKHEVPEFWDGKTSLRVLEILEKM